MVQPLVGDDRDGYLWSAEKRGGRSPVPTQEPTKAQILLFGTYIFRAEVCVEARSGREMSLREPESGCKNQQSKNQREESMSKLRWLVVVALLGFNLSACQKEGPAEKAGKEVDKAAKDLGQSMEKAADSVKEAAKTK